MRKTVRWLGVLCVAATVAAAGGPPAGAADQTVVLQGRFGRVVSNTISKLPPPADVELGQEVRVDDLTSADPDWNDATLTLFEQNLSYPSRGTYRLYGVLNTKSGAMAYLELAGKWDVVMRDGRFAEAPFDGQGRLLGGTGNLQGISGTATVNGKVDAEQNATYSLELRIAH